MKVRAIYHDRGNPCNGIAFYLVNPVVTVNCLIRASDTRLLDGTAPRVGDSIVCGTCGGLMPCYISLSSAREMEVEGLE